MKKLEWGIVGGGQGSQIGKTHRMSATLDGFFDFTAAAMDISPEKGKAYAQKLGLSQDRSYGSWQEMLEGECKRKDKLDLVTVATPNDSHFEIASAFLKEGFNILCEKPLTLLISEAEELVKIAKQKNAICAVNFGYAGYAMVRQMKEMVRNGDLGAIRLVMAEFAHGFHADAKEADNPRVRWRYQPEKAGISGVFFDAGSHALYLSNYILGDEVAKVSADFCSCVAGRTLEDDAQINFRFKKGTVGRLWSSAIAVGRMHGLTISLYGEKGGVTWEQERPNQLYHTPLGKPTIVLERGADYLYEKAKEASRVTIGHAEGFIGAFANIYSDLARDLLQKKQNPSSSNDAVAEYPTASAGVANMKVIFAATKSAKENSGWVDC